MNWTRSIVEGESGLDGDYIGSDSELGYPSDMHDMHIARLRSETRHIDDRQPVFRRRGDRGCRGDRFALRGVFHQGCETEVTKGSGFGYLHGALARLGASEAVSMHSGDVGDVHTHTTKTTRTTTDYRDAAKTALIGIGGMGAEKGAGDIDSTYVTGGGITDVGDMGGMPEEYASARGHRCTRCKRPRRSCGPRFRSRPAVRSCGEGEGACGLDHACDSVTDSSVPMHRLQFEALEWGPRQVGLPRRPGRVLRFLVAVDRVFESSNMVTHAEAVGLVHSIRSDGDVARC